jgi:hypothetical protein
LKIKHLRAIAVLFFSSVASAWRRQKLAFAGNLPEFENPDQAIHQCLWSWNMAYIILRGAFGALKSADAATRPSTVRSTQNRRRSSGRGGSKATWKVHNTAGSTPLATASKVM